MVARFRSSLPLLVAILLCASTVSAASPKALELRKENGLTEQSPSDAFVSGNFLADEMNPTLIFGSVGQFVTSRACPTAWLIEEGEKKRLDAAKTAGKGVEYTLYLEEDCPAGVTYFVFVDQSFLSAEQWLIQWYEWRRQFHKSKAEGYYGATKAKLEKAIKDGAPVVGELRFLLKNGELSAAQPEDALRGELKFSPLYDLEQGKALPR